jgi:hypothetical protein
MEKNSPIFRRTAQKFPCQMVSRLKEEGRGADWYLPLNYEEKEFKFVHAILEKKNKFMLLLNALIFKPYESKKDT